MASVDVGQQSIVAKYSTPLRADYLNTLLPGFSNPGLLVRPKIISNKTSNGVDVSIYPFSLLIEPNDKISTYVDENGNTPIYKLVKITTTTIVKVSLYDDDFAIGFSYSFANNSITQAQWFGEFVTLNVSNINSFKGVIVATSQHFENSITHEKNYSITTSGADISDALLRYEGWNPNKWLSLISPRRAYSGKLNKLEVRTHNDDFDGYFSGNAGVVHVNSCEYQFNTDIDEHSNPSGIRGFMPNLINCFNLTSHGFNLCDGNSELPVTKQSGGIFAIVDASAVNLPDRGGTGSDPVSFANKLKIHPVEQDVNNIYYDEKTLYIK